MGVFLDSTGSLELLFISVCVAPIYVKSGTKINADNADATNVALAA